MPCSRWSHFITPANGDTTNAEEGFLMFGGVNQNSYCKAVCWNFTLHRKNERRPSQKCQKSGTMTSENISVKYEFD